MIYKFNSDSKEWMENYNKTYVVLDRREYISILNRGTSVIKYGLRSNMRLGYSSRCFMVVTSCK